MFLASPFRTLLIFYGSLYLYGMVLLSDALNGLKLNGSQSQDADLGKQIGQFSTFCIFTLAEL